MAEKIPQVWISRDFSRCCGCRKCEIECSLNHEGKFWPEASRVRVFMLVPGAEFPHLCAQCEGYPCVSACPFKALSVNAETAAVAVDAAKCVGCGKCIDACPGKVPQLHPQTKKALICDLCGGNPRCAKICGEGDWNCLTTVSRKDRDPNFHIRAQDETAKKVAAKLYGEKAEEFF